MTDGPGEAEAPQNPAPQPPKDIVFRVDEIPPSDQYELDENIRSVVEQDTVLGEVVDTLFRRSLAPYGDYLCATFSITTSLLPENLVKQLGQASKRKHDYKYTCKFLGITPLYDAQGDAEVDIIAVPGLGSHALGSWKSPTSDHVWLRDFLPKDIPGSRVLIYGYDTGLENSRSKQSIENLGQELLDKINAFRAMDGTGRRPTIFLGHSLGGLLVKEALLRASQSEDAASSDLFAATFKLLFFGVPNLGLRNQQLMTVVQGQPNENFIRDLLVDKDSEPTSFLKRLSDQFARACKGRYKVVGFYERMESPTVKMKDGKLRLVGPPCLLVTEESATSTGLVAKAEQDTVALNADHSGLVKYDSRIHGEYPRVMERLRSGLEEERIKVARRFNQPRLSDDVKNCLVSLAFEGNERRFHEITTAADGTCKWFLTHESVMQWINKAEGYLWVYGNPGSGKSTLIKYAFGEVQNLFGSNILSLAFFFHDRGYELQRTTTGLFRYLLHKLLSSHPGDFPELLRSFSEKKTTEGKAGKNWNWELEQLRTFFELALPRILAKQSVILFIDAIDECGKDSAIEFIDYFNALVQRLPSTLHQFRICGSCRYYPSLPDEGASVVKLEKENEQDIVTFVQSRCLAGSLNSDICNLILNRAQGSFLWTRLILERVDELCDLREPLSKIKMEIDQSNILDDFYNRMISRAKHKSKTLQMMRWLCFSRRPLTHEELQWAVLFDPGCEYESLEEGRRSHGFAYIDDQVDKWIRNVSCGFAEIVGFEGARVVQFIHQSAKDYILQRGLWRLGGTDEPAPDNGVQYTWMYAASHCYLARCSISYLRMALLCRSPPRCPEDMSRFPLLHYAMAAWISHVRLGEPAEAAPEDILNLLGWPDEDLLRYWVRVHRAIEQWTPDTPWKGSNFVHVFAQCGLEKLLSFLLDQVEMVEAEQKDKVGTLSKMLGVVHIQKITGTSTSPVYSQINDHESSYGSTPLLLAAENGHQRVVKMLLDRGRADVDARDNENYTPLMKAAEKGHEEVVKVLLNTRGVRINVRSAMHQETALFMAVAGGYNNIVELLLNTGKATVDTRDDYFNTPLIIAAGGGNQFIVKKILQTGKADVNATSKRGYTALWKAVQGNHDGVVEVLLGSNKLDANPSPPWFHDNTILSLATEKGYDTMVKRLLSTGKAKINKGGSSRRTPLMQAAIRGHESIVMMLLDVKHIDVNTEDAQGETALSWAVRQGHMAIAERLLQTGKARISKDDTSGKKTLQWAIDEGYERVASMLLEHMRDSHIST